MSDRNMVKKVDTFKSGPFVFSLNYDEDKLRPLLIKAKVLFNTIADIPLLPNLASQLEEELIRKSIFGTAAIEGNPLSEEAVNEILSKEEVSRNMGTAERQIQNLKEAYKIIKNTKFSYPFLLKEKLIKDFHKVIVKGLGNERNQPGKYRNYVVKVGNQEHGGVYTPPKIIEDIENLMKYFIDWINSNEVLKKDAAVRAALAHYYLTLIHPFGDGNGRVARIIEAILLKSAGIRFVPHMLSNFYYRNIDDYFRVFSLSERNDFYNITPFLEFFLEGLITSLNKIQTRIFSMIRLFTLKDYYLYLRKKRKITQRQFDLLILLLERGIKEEFSLKDLFEKEIFRVLYRNKTERTARRDLKVLEGMKLIKTEGKGRLSLNFMALG